MAKITALPAANQLTGDEHLPIVQAGDTKRVTMSAFRALITPYLQNWYKGDTGKTGPAVSTFSTIAALKAAPLTNRVYNFAPDDTDTSSFPEGPYFYKPGDFSGTDFEDEIASGAVVAHDDVPLAMGALVRQAASSIAVTGGNSLQHAIAVAKTPRDLIASTTSLKVRSTIRTEDGFLYQVALRNATDHHLTTAAGVKLYIADGAITPDALGAPRDGSGDVGPYIERAYKISNVVDLVPTSIYLMASVIGLPDQDLYTPSKLVLRCNGATIIVKSAVVNNRPEPIFTSARAKAAPESLTNLYVSKLYVAEGNWVQHGTSSIFNGDRIYNLILRDNHFGGIDTVVSSYRAREGGLTEGYIQSVAFQDNTFTRVRRITDAKRAFDVSFFGNKATECEGGLYIDSLTAQAAVISLRMGDNMWQGGGCMLVVGQVLGGGIDSGYFEHNAYGDAATAKCDLWFKAGGAPTSAFRMSGLSFQPSSAQIADPDYVPIRWDGKETGDNIGSPVLISCYTLGDRLITPGVTTDIIGTGSQTANARRNALAPFSTTSAHRTTFSGTQFFVSSSALVAGVFTVASISVADILALLPSQTQRSTKGEISIMIQHKTPGGVTVGMSYATIGFIVMAASEGVGTANAVNDVLAKFFLKNFSQIDPGQAVDNLGAVTQTHFTNPALSVSRSGTTYLLGLSNYAAPSVLNYGPAAYLISHATIEADARNNSSILTSPIALT